MKTNKRHIIHAWILLICFIAGQYMVYSHQHKLIKETEQSYSANKPQPHQTVSEKCQLCDAMHHNSMVITSNVTVSPISVTDHVYKSPVYNFTSLALILSGGRAPPCANYSV
ncbi:hypothetical protein KXD93_07525 [Mucilaginibacter sp. BJC16-A38]|uniref:hypothetical protein n=1 Tax=Mucilaginibacter phenanthrenivorans TaxID=1234842 RepID=UPI00215761E9|nr:hypothetical protein [Mucilaginibacter phenanthrenivorans]MCR8557485.1 hypothetical protein [Mucilaginibacter phenanthrenivorans]